MTPPPPSTPAKSTRPRPRPKRKIVENGLFKTVPSASFYDPQAGPSKPEPSKRRALSVVTVSDTEPEISITKVVRHPLPPQPTTSAPREIGKGKARDAGMQKEAPSRDDDVAGKRRRETDSPLTPLPDENITLPQIPTPPPYSPVEQPSSPVARPKVRALSIPWSEIMRASSSPVERASSDGEVGQPEEEENALGLVLSPVHDDSARDANETEESNSYISDEGPRNIWDLVLPIKGRKRARTPPAAPEHALVNDAIMRYPSPAQPNLPSVIETSPAVECAAAPPPAPSPADEPEPEINDASGLVLAPVHDDSARDGAGEESDSDSGDEEPKGIWDLVLPIKRRKRARTPPDAPEDEPVTDANMRRPSPFQPHLSSVTETSPAVEFAAASPPAPSRGDDPELEINILLADLALDPDLPIAGVLRKHALSEEELGAFVGYVRESGARGVDDVEWLCERYRRYVSNALLDTADLISLYSTTLFTLHSSSATYPPSVIRCAACRGSSPALDAIGCCSACQSVHAELHALPGEWMRYVRARREVVQAWEGQLQAELENGYQVVTI